MTDAQLYIAIGVPMFAVIAGFALNMVQISGIRNEISAIRADVQSVREDIREIRASVNLLTGKVYEMMGQK